MIEVWQDCGNRYEDIRQKEISGEWSKEQADIWLEFHCKMCPYFSGYNCNYRG